MEPHLCEGELLMCRRNEYDASFCRLSSRVEKGLITLIVCSVCLLVAAQTACSYEPVRHLFVKADRWEGTFYKP